MRWLSVVVLLVATAPAAPTVAQLAPKVAPTEPRAAPTIAVRVTRAIGGFDRELMQRMLRKHAVTCRREGASGVVRLRLALRDQPDRRGMRVLEARGDPDLRGCLRRRLSAAAWPTGHLDGIAEFSARIRVTP